MDREPTVLVAEDDPFVRSLIAKVLRSPEYRVVLAEDGAHAWELARDLRPEVIVSDWMMPEMDGVELLRRVKADCTLQHVHFIMVTAREDRRDRVSGLDAGADDYLTKPFDNAELQLRVRAGLRKVMRYLQSVQDSQQDPLTGVSNRRLLEQYLHDVTEGHVPRPQQIVVFMIDGDDFKSINDRYGHAVGDEVLKEVGRMLREHTRSTDLVVRLGGDEFLLLVPDATEEAVERIRARLEQASNQIELSVDGQRVTARFSVGVTTWDPARLTPQDAFTLADREMYRVKAKRKSA